MFKQTMSFMLILLLAAGLCACGGQSESSVSDKPEGNYEQIANTNKTFSYYQDDKVVKKAAEEKTDLGEKADVNEIEHQVTSYALSLLYSPYKGRGVVMDSSFVSAPGLAAELDARILYVAATAALSDFSRLDFYLRFDDFTVRDDVARVEITTELRDRETNEVKTRGHEGFIFKKNGQYWDLVNDIMDTGRGGAKAIEALLATDDSERWLTDFSYSRMKRSDYEDAHDYMYFIKENSESFELDPDKLHADDE